MIERIAFFGAVFGILYVALAGIRRLPLRYAGLVALGNLAVFAALVLTTEEIDPAILVGVAALGGALATLGYERGERRRAEISASILSNGQAG